MVRNPRSSSRGVPNPVDRRTFLKVSSGAAVGVGVTAGGAGHVAASDGRGGPGDTVEGELPHPDRGRLRVDESVRSITPHYYLLTLDKDRVLDLVGKSEGDGKKQTEIRDFLKDAWREYPVRRGRDGDDTVLSLATERSKGAIESEDEKFSGAAKALGRGYAAESDDASAQWNGSNHNDMSEKVCEWFDLYNYEISDVASHADDPDSDPCQGCSADVFPGSWAMPGWVKNKIEQGLNEFAHHFGHYYDPNYYSYTMAGISIEFDGIGGAPWFCGYEMGQAQDGSFSTEREHLGRATHYVQDVAVPLHSGMGVEQMNLGLHCDWNGCAAIDPYYDEHFGYENYVSRNLTSGESFLDEFGSIHVYNSDPVQVVKNCADIGNDDSYEVFHLLLNNGSNPDDWSSSSDRNDLNDVTENVMAWAGGYTHALVNQIYDK